MSRAGFLWDSLSRNTGDRAVGETLLRLARRAGLERLEPVRIGEPFAGRFRLLVIGGGELLHPAGHGFYDVFRVPGEHVLNTVGTSGNVDASFLSSYRLVTVRSAADRDNMQCLDAPARVAPCLTVLFPTVAGNGGETTPRGSLLVHLHSGTFRPGAASAMVEVLRQLSPPVAFLPLTAYNADADLQAVFARAAGFPPPLEIDGPDAALGAIRRARAVVVTSLHAALFAYVAGVPFLAVPYAPKMRHFLVERGLEHRLLPDLEALPGKLHLLAPDSVDWGDRLAADIAAARRTADDILSIVDEALSHQDGARTSRSPWTEPPDPVEANASANARHAEFGRRVAQFAEDELAGRRRLRRHMVGGARRLAKVVPGIGRIAWVRGLWRRCTRRDRLDTG